MNIDCHVYGKMPDHFHLKLLFPPSHMLKMQLINMGFSFLMEKCKSEGSKRTQTSHFKL